MRRLLLIVSLTILFVIVAGSSLAFGDSSWPMTAHDPAATSFNSGEHSLNARNIHHLHKAWEYRHPLSAFVVARGNFYGVTPLGLLVLSSRTGKRLHLFTSKELGTSTGLMASSLAYARGVLVFTSVQEIVAVNASTGVVLWRQPIHFTTNVSIVGNVVYTGGFCFNGCPTQALDLRSGRKLWQNPTGGLIQSIVDGRVYEGLLWHGHCQDRIFDAHTGSLVATLSSCGSWTGNSTRTYGIIFPPDTNVSGRVEPVQTNGQPGNWAVKVGRPDSAALVFAYGTLFATTARPHDGIVAISASRGTVLWHRAIRGTYHLVAANHLFFVMHRGGAWVDALNTGNGRLVRRFRVAGANKKSLLYGGLIADGQLFATVRNDTVVMRP
jgi:outer membrane protein assembly factor BamB